ncbi:MAG TPA: polysaccharide biosynthesis tyrosine autokinase [Ramlibacter sp.]|nr:polysaccharide biosynthesis tyrosine autokinase [Ramlibacter sp.]
MSSNDFATQPKANVRATDVAVRHPYYLQAQVAEQQEALGDDSLTLTTLLRLLYKHKWLLLLIVVVSGAVAGVRTLLSTPVYRSTATIQIERAAPRVISFNTDEQESGWTDEMTSLKTQYELLRSRSLAERVISELHLDRPGAATTSGTEAPASAAAVQAPQSFFSRIVGGYRKLSTPANRSAEVLSREAVVGGFLGALTVDPVRSSRLIKLHVDNTNPELAARIANTTAQAFIAMGLERKMEASLYAKTFLEDQIQQIKVKLEESERKLNRYAQAKQILTLDEKTSVIGQTYTDYAGALARAEQDRMRAEALYAEIQVNPTAVPAVLDNKTVQSYKEQKAKLEIEYQQNLRIYKPDFPRMTQIRAQITEIDSQIKHEVSAVAAGIKSQFEAAQRQETLLRQKLGETRKQVQSTQDSSIDLNLLKREVDTNRQLYDGLLQRLKQVGVSGGIVANNVSVVDAAEPPLFPYKPNLSRNLMLGLGIGLFLGVCMVLLLEFLDDSIKLPDEVERLLGVPLMGIIPFFKQKRGESSSVALLAHTDLRSTLAESYRSVRTALQFSTPEGAPKLLMVTSTTRGEGKSTTALALAINFAQLGQRVLLVDGDMRNPSVHKQLGIPNELGLSNLLSSDNDAETLMTPTAIANLSVLTAGPVPPNPVDLLMGPKLGIFFDLTASMGIHYVIVDAPPLLGIADSVVLGNQIQNILFVVQASRTRKGQVRDALRRLRLGGLLPRGVLLTQTQRGAAAHDYESYYGYGGGDKGKSTSKPELPSQPA